MALRDDLLSRVKQYDLLGKQAAGTTSTNLAGLQDLFSQGMGDISTGYLNLAGRADREGALAANQLLENYGGDPEFLGTSGTLQRFIATGANPMLADAAAKAAQMKLGLRTDVQSKSAQERWQGLQTQGGFLDRGTALRSQIQDPFGWEDALGILAPVAGAALTGGASAALSGGSFLSGAGAGLGKLFGGR